MDVAAHFVGGGPKLRFKVEPAVRISSQLGIVDACHGMSYSVYGNTKQMKTQHIHLRRIGASLGKRERAWFC
jgi:hypothetical protein